MRKVVVGPTVLLLVAGLTTAALLLSGGVSLISTNGISMQPRLRASDLVVVRPASQYRRGDVVAYRSTQLGTAVLHRIVAVEDGRYTFQGDNNDWLDSEQPTRSQLIGKEWLHIRGGGRVLDLATAPPVLAAMSFLLVISGGSAAHIRRRRKKERASVSTHSRSAPRPEALGGIPPTLRQVIAATLVIALGGAVLAGLSWTRSPEIDDAAPQSAASTLEFSYTATVPRSPVYDGTTVKPPQPVFRQLTERVDVTFRYEGEPGTVRVNAELSTASGWRSTVLLAEAEEFAEPFYEGSVPLDLAALQARADAAATVIGLAANDVKIAVVPEITSLEGSRFAPRLELVLDPVAMRLSSDATLTVGGGEAIARTEGGPATLSVLGRGIDVTLARTLSLGALALAGLLAAGLVFALRASGRAPEAERIRRRYGQLILPVLPVAFPPGRPVIDVPDVESLARLAERYGLLVLHWSRGGVDTYVVQDERTTYRYRPGLVGQPADDLPLPDPASIRNIASGRHEALPALPRPPARTTRRSA